MRLARITPCLWFDSEAEEAARFYCSIFSNSRIQRVSRYGEAGHEIHGKPAGSVMAAVLRMKKLDIAALKRAYES
jgi:predicted 3-demethylubiquinone-9 3-methyltransferase (glyoxalase superfamily)